MERMRECHNESSLGGNRDMRLLAVPAEGVNMRRRTAFHAAVSTAEVDAISAHLESLHREDH